MGVPDGLRVGFTGHEQEDTLGLVDMRGRYYDPTQRRFLTTDPVIASPLSSQGFSPYAYVSNNPLSRIDPTGFWGEEADTNGFMDEGDWDLSGMDGGGAGAGGGGSGGGGGGMGADYDDYDNGDMDFDPGESMAGQDEEGGNDGTDDYSDSGSKAPPRGIDGADDYLDARTTARVDFTGGAPGHYFEVGRPFLQGRGGSTYRSQASERVSGFEPRDPEEHADDDPETRADESQYWISHFLFSRATFRVVVSVRWVGPGATPASIRIQHRNYDAIRSPAERYRAGGSTVGPEPRQGPLFEERTVTFDGRVATTTFTVTRVGTWHADRFSVSFQPGIHVTVVARPVAR